MATNNTKRIPSFMMSTATSKGKFPSTRTPSTPPATTKPRSSSQKKASDPRTHARTASKDTSPTSKTTPVQRPLATSSSTRRPIKEAPKIEVKVEREMTKWERLMEKIPADCEVFPRPKAEKPAKKEDLWSLMDKGYHDVPDEPPKTWHILETMLSYKIRELREKWEVDCPNGLFWVTFKGRKIDPVTKDGKWMVRAKIRKSDKWMHAFLIKNPPTIERDYSLKPTDEVVWAIGDYDYWDVLPDW